LLKFLIPIVITALYNLKLVSNGTIRYGKAVLIENETIVDVVDDSAIPESVVKIDIKGNFLSPGLIDLQIYSAGSPLFFGGSPSVEALSQMEHALRGQGCTGFLATIATNTDAVVEQGIKAMLAYQRHALGNLLGLHLEGPYLNPNHSGAHPQNLIKKATLQQVKQWVEMAEGCIKMMTIAPELQDDDVIEYLNQNKIVVSAGHTGATYQQAKQFLNGAVKATTHLYNAMQPMHHRQPGIIAAIFEKQPYTSIVADGIHVDYAMIALAKRELNDKLFLITDAVTPSNDGIYQHQLKGDHYSMPDGTLSGSALTMLKAVSNCVRHVGIDVAEAVNMGSLYPARVINQDGFLGKIDKGYQANLIAFDDDFSLTGRLFKGAYVNKTVIKF
jgi:N-acetylglucosamine-6-phosphate deacetylase